jgi:hypothetical protein
MLSVWHWISCNSWQEDTENTCKTFARAHATVDPSGESARQADGLAVNDGGVIAETKRPSA